MRIKCEICNSSLIKEGEYLVCEHCGVKYTTEYLKNKLLDEQLTIIKDETAVRKSIDEFIEEISAEETIDLEELPCKWNIKMTKNLI